MNKAVYLLFHKDHPLSLDGVNSGAENATLSLSKYLAAEGFRTIVCAELKVGESKRDGVEFWDLGPTWEVGAALKRVGAIGHPYHLISGGRAQPIMESRSDPLCLSRTLICHDPSGTASGVRPDILTRVSNVIAVSEAQKQLFVQAGADAGRITVINNGVDLNLFAPGDIEKRDWMRMVFVGALVQDKGIGLLIHSYATLKNQFPNLTLDVYGSPGMWGRDNFFNPQQVAESLPGIKFHGAVPPQEIAKAFQSAGLCVIPSIWFDSFPLTSVEAQVSGCPVVAFDVGGLKESLFPDKTGVIIPQVGQENLTEALRQLLAQPQKLKELSRNAAELARQRFDWKKTAQAVIQLTDQASKAESASKLRKGRIGIVSTWNQQCGLATYARYMLSAFPKESYIVFSEENVELVARDEDFVERCWNRGASDLNKLLSQIKQHQLRAVHFNLHGAGMINPGALLNLIAELKNLNVSTIVHLHSTYTVDSKWGALVTAPDRLIVHTEQNRLQAIANGACPERVSVLPHGIEQRADLPGREALRVKLGMPTNEKIVLSFGFVQPHKGMEGIIESVIHLTQRGIACRGYIVGNQNPADPNSDQYLKQLMQLAHSHGVSDRVVFVTKFIEDSAIGEYLRAADLVLMNYRSQHYESSGACSLALGAGALVATSMAPPFLAFGDAVWHITSGFPVALSVEQLLGNAELQRVLRQNVERYSANHSWSVTATKLFAIYESLGFRPVATAKSDAKAEASIVKVSEVSKKLKILMQNRPTAYSMPGGDTVLMENLRKGLEARGVAVTVDLEGKEDPRKFDLVHLYNFAIPAFTRSLAENAYKYGIPYVVSTLCEDITCFHNQSRVWAEFLVNYTMTGQQPALYQRNLPDLAKVQKAEAFNNEWTARHAAALFPNGAVESDTINRLYPGHSQNIEIKLGYEVGAQGSAEDFIKEYGIKDFVLCVGRLESRKNQLGLLKALEDSELPVVLAAGGFSYQPDYDRAVRTFKRKGTTLVLGRLSEHMLASAYEAAKVHALPSWYELPGLVSLEAGYHGCNVVATNYGTARDYLGDKAFYCDPGDQISILNAVNQAYYTPLVKGLKEVVMTNTWDSAAERTLGAYKQVLGVEKAEKSQQTIELSTAAAGVPSVEPARAAQTAAPIYDFDTSSTEFQEVLERGELAAKSRNYAEAHRQLARAEELNAQSARVLRARAATYLSESNISEAERYFERALAVTANDSRSLIGRGMCEMMKQQPANAYDYFVKALRINPNELVALNQLVECSFALNRFDDLRMVLESFLFRNPGNLDMQFCLAGCYFKLQDYQSARRVVAMIREKNPTHEGSRQLEEQIAKCESGVAQTKAAPIGAAQGSPTQNVAIPSATTLKPASTELKQSVVTNPLAQFLKPLQQPAATLPAAGSTHVQSFETIGAKPAPAQTALNTRIENELTELEDKKRQKQYAEVKSGCDRIAASPLAAPVQKERATILRADVFVLEGDVKSATEIYDRVLSANPRAARAMCGKGALAAFDGNWSGAESLFNQAVQIDERCDVGFAGLGLCAQNNRNISGAWSYYRQALNINPENQRALFGLVDLGYQLGRLSELEQSLRAYLDMHPVDFNFLYALAGCCFAQNRVAEAKEEIEKILIFDPNHKKASELRDMITQGATAGGARA